VPSMKPEKLAYIEGQAETDHLIFLKDKNM
jgi:hypothetical protein